VVNSKRGKLRARGRFWVLLGGKNELGRVIDRVRRSGLMLNTEVQMQVIGLSCDASPEWKWWRIGLERKLGWGVRMQNFCWSIQHKKIWVDEHKIYTTVLTVTSTNFTLKDYEFSGDFEENLSSSPFITKSFSPLHGSLIGYLPLE
jgi:hypothetical protein